MQRSYSLYADNPDFLFDQANKYNYYENTRQFNFDISKNWDDFKLNISQAYENQDIMHRDVYKPSTNGFINGLYNRRDQKNEFYNSNILTSYEFRENDFKNKFSLNHILNEFFEESYTSKLKEKDINRAVKVRTNFMGVEVFCFY